MLADTNPSRFGRRVLKRFLYSQMTLRDAILILFGKVHASLPFTVKAEPCSVYFNFRIKPECRQEFTDYINLAEGFAPAPIRCLAGEEPEFLLTLNIYEVSGIANGIRAEWSTYITDKEGTPRYMVLEARSSEFSMDPVDIITKKGRVEHVMNPSSVRSVVASEDDKLFTSNLALREDHPFASIAPEWVTANDFIYWRNGICDRTYYDASLADASVRHIPATDVSIDDQTHWARFIDPSPRHVLKYDGALQFMIVPWYNV